MANRAFAVIYANSVVASEDFYLGLGFEETSRTPAEGEPGYVSLRRGDAELGIVSVEWPRQELGLQIAEGTRFEMYIYVDDVDVAAAGHRDTLVREPRDTPWGERVAYLRDPDGNPVVLAQA
jgi:lactoylglutathione lyase